jgi:hypothetical protein
MKKIISILALNVMALGLVSSRGEAPVDKSAQRILELVQEIQAQQAQIADNQTKIDSKMADLTESIRVARLSAAKAGK